MKKYFVLLYNKALSLSREKPLYSLLFLPGELNSPEQLMTASSGHQKRSIMFLDQSFLEGLNEVQKILYLLSKIPS